MAQDTARKPCKAASGGGFQPPLFSFRASRCCRRRACRRARDGICPRIARLVALLGRPVEAARQPILNVPFVIVALVGVLGLLHAGFKLVLSEDATNEMLLLFAFLPARYDLSLPAGLLPGGWGADIWTFVTYALIHADLNHLIFNLLWLVAFGTPVARRFGPLRFIAFF